MGPDSINLDRPTQKAKIDGGNVMVPSGTNPGWRPTYYQYMLDDTRIYYPDKNTYGSVGIGINAKTSNLEACLKFFDVLANPDDYMVARSGVEGDQWYIAEDGHVYLTEAKIESVQNNTPFIFCDGKEWMLWNTAWITNFGVKTSFTDKDGNFLPVNMNGWKEYQALGRTNPTYLKWNKTVGYDTWVDWLDAEGRYYRTSPLDDVKTFATLPDDMMKLTNEAIRDEIVSASWQMVYAETDEAFDAIWEQMVSDAKGLGAEDVIAWRLSDLEAAAVKRDALLK